MSFNEILPYFVRLMVILLVLPIHEFAHGWVAYKLGDHTAASTGRLDLNPLAHVDMIGSLCLLFFGFGWAKPVPINPHNFTRKISLRGGIALTAAAGPISNLLVALLVMIVYKILILTGVFISASTAIYVVRMVLVMLISINISLAVFNLFPIPPLDGYNVLSYFLPGNITYKIAQYQQMFFIGLIVLISTPILSTPINVVAGWLLRLLDYATFFLGRIT